MSAQGATLRRGTVHIPIWPVAVVVVLATATMIGLSSIDTVAPLGTITSVTQSERLANSSTAIREQGAVLPVVTPSEIGFVGLENPGAYATQLPSYAGFENPGAYITQAPTFVPGLENPGAYPVDESFTPTAGALRPSGEICVQCK